VAGLRRRTGVVVLVVTATLALASCGGGTNADALKACHGVRLALAAYDHSLRAPTPAARSADLVAATHQISLVQGDAALADSADGSYDALMTLLQQAQELPFRDVAPALKATCAAVTSPSSQL
jgi:hypothetical protein